MPLVAFDVTLGSRTQADVEQCLWERPPQLNALIDGRCWRGELVLTTVVPAIGDSFVGGRVLAAAEREDLTGTEWVILELPLPVLEGMYALDGAGTDIVLFRRPASDTEPCRSWGPDAGEGGILCIDHVDPTSGVVEGSFGLTVRPLDDPGTPARVLTRGRFVIQVPAA